MDNMKIYNSLCKPPKRALKQIKGGRLSGMTDINPQWRYEALTEQFGPCGVGWKFEIDKLWLSDGSEQQIIAWAKIDLYHSGPDWSDPIPGVGGSTFIAKESKGLHTSDEAFKMAITDALSTAAKMIGVGGDIYAGKWDGTKYKGEKRQTVSEKQTNQIVDMINEKNIDEKAFLTYMGFDAVNLIPEDMFSKAMNTLRKAKGQDA